jgi:hypothetical protein
MIMEREDFQRGAVVLPSYFGIDVFGTVVGTSSQPGIEILRNMLKGVHYQRALESGSFASLGQTLLPYSRKESWSAFEMLSRRTEELLQLPEADELGRVRPSTLAVDRARDVLFTVFASGADLPSRAEVCTDAEGAIRILWDVEYRSLELICPFDQTDRIHVYIANEENHKLAFDLARPRLKRMFSWLSGWTADFPK